MAASVTVIAQPVLGQALVLGEVLYKVHNCETLIEHFFASYKMLALRLPFTLGLAAVLHIGPRGLKMSCFN